MNLSENFTYGEAGKSQIAARYGIDNRPPEDLIPALQAVAVNILQPVRNHFGVPYSPSSWYRCEFLEKAINWNGRDDSPFGRWCRRRDMPIGDDSWARYFARKQHPSGEAVDFEVPGVANLELARWIRDNLEFDQLILEFWNPNDAAAGWVHGSFSSTNRNRGEVLTLGRGGTIIGLPEG